MCRNPLMAVICSITYTGRRRTTCCRTSTVLIINFRDSANGDYLNSFLVTVTLACDIIKCENPSQVSVCPFQSWWINSAACQESRSDIDNEIYGPNNLWPEDTSITLGSKQSSEDGSIGNGTHKRWWYLTACTVGPLAYTHLLPPPPDDGHGHCPRLQQEKRRWP